MEAGFLKRGKAPDGLQLDFKRLLTLSHHDNTPRQHKEICVGEILLDETAL